MSQIIKNIALYLTPKLGTSKDWKLILTIYEADHSSGGFPVGFPIAVSEREVSDITREGWYSFNFENPELDSGNYCMVLSQSRNNTLPDEDFFKKNFVEWVHSSDISTNKQYYAFSSDYGFTILSGENAYSESYVYGYGYGYGQDDPLDYFNVLGFEGDLLGYGLGLEPDQIQIYQNYAYGFETVDFISDSNIKRNFKIYSNFNDITFEDVFDLTDLQNKKKVFVNLPEGSEETLNLANRQDFVIASRDSVDIVGNYITLSDSGKRVYSTDITAFSVESAKSYEVDWNESNFFLSINDVNYADIINPIGNTNRAACLMAASCYYSGVYFSTNSGSVWKENILGLSIDNSVRNLSCVKFSPDGSYVIAFDNTSSDEKGKVFSASISKELINSNSVNWNLLNSLDYGSGGLKGRVVNDVVFFSNSEIWAGTDDGIYKSLDSGATWSVFSTGLPPNTFVNQISGDLTSGLIYGYGYGYGSGLDYFDVIGFDGYRFGYGYDTFETDYTDNYGYGYGYEYTSDGSYSSVLIFIATENGVFRHSNDVWNRVGENSILQANTVLLENGKVYVGTDEGFFRSSDQENVFIDGLEFEGTDEFDNFYAQGLLKNKTTRIIANSSNTQEIFVSQYGGVFVSGNGGGNFNNISNKLGEKRVKFILTNPLNNRILYAFTESTKFSNAAITILMDCSGSMTSNDPENKRIDMAKNIISQIASSATNTPYYQLVRFGLLDSEYQKIKNYAQSRGLNEDEFGVSGIINITEGFTSSDTFVLNQLEALKSLNFYGNKTPLNEAINLISKSLNNGGANFSYLDKEYDYQVGNIISRRFRESDKILIVITDGFNSTVGKNLEYITKDNSEFNNLRSNIYIISVGQNVNYESLNSLANSRENVYLYHSGFYENLENEIRDIILNKEEFRRRIGKWNKIITYNSNRKFTKINVLANVPPSTAITYRVRTSNDKDIWSDWIENIDVNIESNLDLFGKYFQIELNVESMHPSFSPEVKRITISSIEPKESYLFFKSKETDTTKEISDFYINSLDDYTLGNISEENVSLNFGFLESDSTNYNFYRRLPRGKRSIVKRKNWENLISEDGFFYTLEGGSWPQDYSITIYDASNGIQDLVEPISSTRYFAIPSLGRVIFYERQSTNKIFKAKFVNTNSVYRVGANFINYTDNEVEYKLHDIAWTYYDDPRTTVVQRNPLPLVPSQLGLGDVFGQISPRSVPSSEVSSYVITAQYIHRSDTAISNAVLSITNGLRINISTDENVDNFRFYKQNAFFERYNIISPSSQNYITLDKLSDSLSVTASDSDELLYQINASFSSNSVFSNESIVFVIGDSSFGGSGLNTYFRQENLLFDRNEISIGEMETTFIVGVSTSISTTPSIGLLESASNTNFPENDSNFNGFDKPLSPNISFGGSPAVRGVVVSPTTVNAGTPFKINILAVDTFGLIDRNFTGTFGLSFDTVGFGNFEQDTYEFLAEDNGTKTITVTTSDSASGVVRVSLTFNGAEYRSNPILVNPIGTKTNIYWGDLNVPSILSDGRQSIEFISSYARNVGLLNFVGISDDLNYLDQPEWNFLISESVSNSTSELTIIPGIRHRSKDYFGERVVLFENTDNIPTLVPTNPFNLSGSQAQIQDLISEIRDYDVITFPVHTAYENDESNNIFKSRAFDFENYRDIISYSPVSDSLDFVSQKEIAIEVFSDHGGIEDRSQFNNENFLISQVSQYLHYALQMGKKFAFIANSGGYASRPGYYTGDQSTKVTIPGIGSGSNRGLTAIVSSGFSRESIFTAIRNRSCYATTGARIYLEFKAFDGNIEIPMGRHHTQTQVNTSTATPARTISFQFRAIADKSNISRIQIIKLEMDNFANATNVLDSFSGPTVELNRNDFGLDTGVLNFTETQIANQGVSGKEFCYYLKITQFNGHVAWSSPIWFDFGREPGIRTSQDFAKDKIFKVTLVEDGSNSNNFGIIKGAPVKDNNEGFPLNHLDIISLRPDFNPKTTRVTPYVTSDDKKVSLMVSDRRAVFTGFRVTNYSDYNLFYGTHFMKTLNEESDYKSENIRSLNDSEISNLNGESVQGSYDESYKFLNSEPDIITGERRKKYRDWFFGTIWQYTAPSNFRAGYSLDQLNIFSSLLPDALIARDPFIYRDGSDFRLFYSGFLGKYPLQTEVENNSELFAQSSILSTLTDSLRELNQREEFLGLINTTVDNPLSGGENVRIMYATDDGLTTRTFLKRATIPNIFSGTAKGNKIYYSYSPNYLKISDTDHRIYYMGWFYGEGSPLKPVLGLFCYRFSDIENISTTGANILCFAFTNKSDRLPRSYVPRRSSFEANNFYPSDIRTDTFNSDFWFQDHPAYAVRWMWLSVIRQDNGDLYAFFNFLNKIDEGIYVGQDNPGTGILFSTDEDNLLFREFDSTESQNVPTLTGKVFFHPFKVSENSQTSWYGIYRNVDSTGSSLSEDIFYSRFNWIPEFSL